jgi:hypothetical protein
METIDFGYQNRLKPVHAIALANPPQDDCSSSFGVRFKANGYLECE